MSEQSDWVDSVTVDPDAALIRHINSARSETKWHETSDVETGDVVAGIRVIFARSLTDQERSNLKAAVIALGNNIQPGLIKDLEIIKGVKAFREFLGRLWKFTLSGHLRTDEIPQPPEPPPE